MKDTPIGPRMQLTLGAIMALMAAMAVRVDFINNKAYGAAISPEAAAVLGMAAILVALLPATASVLGWCWLTRSGTAICLVLTIWCAQAAYSSKQDQLALNSQTSQRNFARQIEKENRAKEVLRSIKETGTVEELGTLAAKADQIETDAGRKLAAAESTFPGICRSRPYLRRCKKLTAAKAKAADALKLAEADAKRAHERLSQAKARAKAEADLAEAEAKSAAGPARKREESPVLTWLFIAVTQIIALLGGKAARLIHGGWQARPRATARPRKAAAPVQPAGGTREPLPANVVPLRKHSVEAWLTSACEPGGELRGGEALKAYKRFAKDAQMTAGELRSILAQIHGDALAARSSGYVVRGISLRASAASQKAAAC